VERARPGKLRFGVFLTCGGVLLVSAGFRMRSASREPR
jgi:hypothetical protein